MKKALRVQDFAKASDARMEAYQRLFPWHKPDPLPGCRCPNCRNMVHERKGGE